MFKTLSAVCLALLAGLSTPAAAQSQKPSQCFAIADANPSFKYLHYASFAAPIEDFSVRIHYIAHASFLIRSAGGLNMVTDFTGFVGNTKMIPDVVTMNHAHDTHWTPNPDPAIPHVLPGWGKFGEGVSHYLDLDEVLIRNVNTDIRSQFSGVEDNGNSIFIFEVAGLCIGHLGHLHHEPTERDYAELGRLDVVMVPVDGGMTLDLPTIMKVTDRLKSSVVIPMHWFDGYNLQLFLDGMSQQFAIQRPRSPSIDLSLRTLPTRPTIIVLDPDWLRDE